jgi:RNA polymerase sigma factor (sigma-70 family)
VEVSALKHAGVAGLHGRSPLLRLQSDERLVALIRRGNHHAFEALMGRYQSRLLAFCRHMLGSKEDAEDVLQEVFAAAFNAMQADERPLNVRPWLYRIARNRSLNHLRRATAIGVDSMDVHFSENGATTADKVHRREDFRALLLDVQGLPETQRTALLLREIDALSYDQIAEAMDTTVPSVKSLLVRARVALAEAAEARQLSCEDVRLELGEVAEGLKKLSPPVRRHVKQCDRCSAFKRQLRETNKALAAIFPVGPLLALKQLVVLHLGGSGAGASAGAAGGAAGTAAAGGAASGLLGAGASAVVTKTAAGLAAAAIVGVGAVEVGHVGQESVRTRSVAQQPVVPAATGGTPAKAVPESRTAPAVERPKPQPAIRALAAPAASPAPATTTPAEPVPAATTPAPPPTETVTDTTVLPTQPATTPVAPPAPAAIPAEDPAKGPAPSGGQGQPGDPGQGQGGDPSAPPSQPRGGEEPPPEPGGGDDAPAPSAGP